MSSEQSPTDIPIQIPVTRILRVSIEATTNLSREDLHKILSEDHTIGSILAETLIALGLIAEVGDVGMWAAQVLEVAQPDRN